MAVKVGAKERGDGFVHFAKDLGTVMDGTANEQG